MVCVSGPPGHDFEKTNLKEEKIQRNHIGHEHGLHIKKMSDCSF